MKPNRKARTSGRRRGIAFALVAALAVAACGGSDDASESADDSATEETTAPEAPSGETKTTLTIVSLAIRQAEFIARSMASKEL